MAHTAEAAAKALAIEQIFAPSITLMNGFCEGLLGIF
jgi:hypothetical protein